MKLNLDILKGIHPGLFLARELQRRDLRGAALASHIGTYRQNLNAILQGRRSMNLPLSLRIEQKLSLPEGCLMTLQLYYDISQEKRKQNAAYHPDLTKYRESLFWDTDMSNIDWQANKDYVIQRVFERGEKEEIEETIRFYGKNECLKALHFDNPYAVYLKDNAHKYLGYAG